MDNRRNPDNLNVDTLPGENHVASGYTFRNKDKHEKAAREFKKAADLGHPRAKAVLGIMHFWGTGCAIDHARSAKLLLEALSSKGILHDIEVDKIHLHLARIVLDHPTCLNALPEKLILVLTSTESYRINKSLDASAKKMFSLAHDYYQNSEFKEAKTLFNILKCINYIGAKFYLDKMTGNYVDKASSSPPIKPSITEMLAQSQPEEALVRLEKSPQDIDKLPYHSACELLAKDNIRKNKIISDYLVSRTNELPTTIAYNLFCDGAIAADRLSAKQVFRFFYKDLINEKQIDQFKDRRRDMLEHIKGHCDQEKYAQKAFDEKTVLGKLFSLPEGAINTLFSIKTKTENKGSLLNELQTLIVKHVMCNS